MVEEEGFSVRESFRLLRSAQAGEPEAVDRLCRAYLPHLRRWAEGRLPRAAKPLLETDDLVQDVLRKAVQALPRFEYRRFGAFQAYLRTALRNRLKDETRRLIRGPLAQTFEERAGRLPSPLEEAIGVETLERFERALAQLGEKQREAVIARIELGMEYAEVADSLELPSPDAARMAVSRALARLLELMGKVR